MSNASVVKTMRPQRLLTTFCALCTFVSMIVQFSIFCGAPIGEFVLGGKYITAPPEMRPVHLAFAIVWLCVGVCYLLYLNKRLSPPIHRVIVSTFFLNTAFLCYAVVWNFFITNSIKERWLMGPLTLVTAICSIIILMKYRMPSAISPQ